MMKVKNLISILAVLGSMSGSAFTLGAEPGSHDQQATKSNFKSSSSSKQVSEEKCANQETKAASNENAGAKTDEAASGKCQPEKDKVPRHDHRKMKNL